MKQFLLLLTLASLLSCNGDGDPGDRDTDSTSNESIENNQPLIRKSDGGPDTLKIDSTKQ